MTIVPNNVVPLFPHALPPVPETQAEIVRAVLMRLEMGWDQRVVVRSCQGLDRVRRVHIGIGAGPTAFLAILTPAQARLAGHCLFSEQAFAGCGDIAARLIEAAVDIDRLPQDYLPPSPGGVSGIGATLGLAALFLAAVLVPVLGQVLA